MRKHGFTPLEMSKKKQLQKQKKHVLSLTGFTLIELLVVIALVVVIAGFATVRFVQSFQARGLEQYVKELTSYIRYVQFRAIETGQIYELAAQKEGKGLDTYAQKEPGKFEEVKTPYTGRFKGEQRIDTKFRKGGEIYFFPDGTVTQDTIEITDSSGKTFSIEIKNKLGAFEVKEHV